MRRPLIALALAALLVLAGCTGTDPLGGGPAGDANDTGDGNLSLVDEDEITTTAESETTGATTTADPGADGTASSTPPGVAENGSVVNVSALRRAHLAELRSLSSYTLDIDRQQRNGAIRAEIAVDNEARTYAGEESGSRLYHANGTTYFRRDSGVDSSPVEFRQIHRGGLELVQILEALNLSVEGTTTSDGTTVLRYRVTGFDRDLVTEIESLTGNVSITTAGLVREIDLDTTVPSGESLPQRYAIEAVNDTSVTPPEWVPENDDGTAPTLSISFEARDDGTVALAHNGGERVQSLQVRYTVDGQAVTETWNPDDGIAVGYRYVTENAPDPGTTVMVVWTGENGEQSAAVGEYEVPE